MKTLFKFDCTTCGKEYEKLYSKSILHDRRFVPRCTECIKKKISDGLNIRISVLKLTSPYHKKNLKDRKQIVWEEQGKKCNKCEYNLFDYLTGPYQMHHIDGNINNKYRDNEELICCNCHFMTDNYGFKSRKHTNESKELFKKKTFTGINMFNK